MYRAGDAGSALYILEKGQMQVEVSQQAAPNQPAHREAVTVGHAATFAPTVVTGSSSSSSSGVLPRVSVIVGSPGVKSSNAPAHTLQFGAPFDLR